MPPDQDRDLSLESLEHAQGIIFNNSFALQAEASAIVWALYLAAKEQPHRIIV